jgi:hypothetical protein
LTVGLLKVDGAGLATSSGIVGSASQVNPQSWKARAAWIVGSTVQRILASAFAQQL